MEYCENMGISVTVLASCGCMEEGSSVCYRASIP